MKILTRKRRDLRASLRAFQVKSIAALLLLSGCAGMRKRPPYPDPERLARIIKLGASGTEEPTLGIDFLEYRIQSRALRPIAAYEFRGLVLTDKTSSPERLNAALVSADFFPLFGMPLYLGRAFNPEENLRGKNHVVILTHALWQRRWRGAAGLIGRTIILDQEKYTVVGILPHDFEFPEGSPDTFDLFAPMVGDDAGLRLMGAGDHLEVIARLKPGVTWDQAQTEMNAIARNLEQFHPKTGAGRSIKLIPLGEKRPTSAGGDPKVMEIHLSQ